MTKKTKLDLVKSISARLRGPLTYGGIQYDQCENFYHIKSVLILWLSVWVDLPGSCPASFGRLLSLVETVDCALLLQTCDMVINELRKSLDDNYDDFKDRLKHAGCPCISLVGLCKPGLQQWFLRLDYTALKAVYSFFSFPTRMHLISDDLQKKEEEAFAERQNPRELFLTEQEESIIGSWFPKTDFNRVRKNYLPCFTTGSSKVGRDLARKYRDLNYSPRMRVNDNLISLFQDWRSLGLISSDFWPSRSRSFFANNTCEDLTIRVMSVPKSHKSYRMVSLEPTNLTYMSNGWAASLVKEIKSYRSDFSRRYCLNTDINNAALARVGSATGKFATIDLSAASDSITLKHFKQWFRGSWLYKPGLLCRATNAEFSDGRTIPLNTFMCMGARLCFLIETITFAAVVHAAIQSTGDEPGRSSFRVYGDDIVVESKYADTVLARLTQNGFLPNALKSYWTADSYHIFRESCGGEYLDGYDITPVRIPRVNFSYLPSVNMVKPNQIQGLVDLANSMSMFPSARHLLIDELRALGPLPLFGVGGIKSPTPNNFDKIVWYNYEWDFFEYEVSQLSTIPVRDRAGRKTRHDHFALVEWLRRSKDRERLLFPEDRVEVEMVSSTNCQWVRKYLEV